MVTAIIADDEPNLVQHLQQSLVQLWPELNICATAANGEQALELVDRHNPDLLFLDIRMPVMDGMAVAAEIADRTSAQPLIIFTTAYDEYAVAAFETAAADYLLKPITQARLLQTIERLQRRLQADSDDSNTALKQLLAQLQQPVSQEYLQWLRTGQGDTTELIAVEDVVYFKAQHKYTSAFTEQGEHVLRLSVKELTQQLDPGKFWQIHRGIIVNVQDIAEARRDLRGRYAVTLKRRNEKLRSSQAYGHLFKHM